MNIYKNALAAAAVCLITAVLFFMNRNGEYADPLLIAFFILLAVGSRGYDALKGFTYTITILAAVTTALFYPQYFKSWNGFTLSTLIKPLIMIIMFGMGTSMSFKDFAV
jgi:BASS family bile acid:Na+ symporter